MSVMSSIFLKMIYIAIIIIVSRTPQEAWLSGCLGVSTRFLQLVHFAMLHEGRCLSAEGHVKRGQPLGHL